MKKRPSSKTPPQAKQRRKKVIPNQEDENSLPKQPFLKKLFFGEEKPDLSELEAGSTTILDILSPTAVDTKSRDYVVVDGVFHAYLYIAGYGYTTTVGSGWLASLVAAGEGVSLSFIVKRQPNPFNGAELHHLVGSRRQVVIAGKYTAGVFCNLPDGVVCMCRFLSL